VLDAVGWLAYIACLIVSFPGQVVSAVGAFVQWLLVPDWNALGAEVRVKIAVLGQNSGSLLGQIGPLLTGSGLAAGQGPPGAVSVSFGGRSASVDLGGPLQSVAGALAPYRDALARWVAFVTVLAVAGLVASFFGLRRPGGDG
jgi:hypothetical protein